MNSLDIYYSLMRNDVLKGVTLDQKVLLLKTLHEYGISNPNYTRLSIKEIVYSIEGLFIAWKGSHDIKKDYVGFVTRVIKNIDGMVHGKMRSENNRSELLKRIMTDYQNTKDEKTKEEIKEMAIKQFGFW